MSHALQYLWIAPPGRESLAFQLKSWKHHQGRDSGAFKQSLPHGLSLTVRAAAAGGPSREDECPCTLKDFENLAEQLLGLKNVVRERYRKVGPEMRDRVDRLFDRAVLLKNSAERTPGGRIPAQLIATLKALEREFFSLENIVNNALEGPVVDDLNGGEAMAETSGPARSELEEQPRSLFFQSLVRESDVDQVNEMKVPKGEPRPSYKMTSPDALVRESDVDQVNEMKVPKGEPRPSYKMTSPDALGSSPLAKFRAEIERRVLEQLVQKKGGTSPAVTAVTPPKVSDAPSTSPAFRNRLSATSEGLFAPLYSGNRSGVQATNRSGVTAQRPVDAAAVGVEEVGTARNAGELEFMPLSTEADKLKVEVSRYKIEYKQAKMRADMAESQVQDLIEQIAHSVTPDMHEQMVRRFTDSLADARVKVAELTAETREKEMMLDAVKQQLLSEQEGLVSKIAELTGELASRVTLKEMESAIHSAVEEVQRNLTKAQDRASALSRQLEEKERTLEEMRERWELEKQALNLELSIVTEKCERIENTRACEKVQLDEAMERVRLLEEELVKVRRRQYPSREEHYFAKVEAIVEEVPNYTLVANNGASNLGFVGGKESPDAMGQDEAVTKEKALALSEEKVEALEKFFTLMGGVINKQEVDVDFWILGVRVRSSGAPSVIRKISNVKD